MKKVNNNQKETSEIQETLKGFVFIIAAMAIFGFYGIFVRFLNVNPQLILFFNALLVALIFSFIFLKDRKKFAIRKHRLLILLLGLAFVGNNLSYFTAFKLTTIANAILTHYTAPIFVAVLAPLLLKEKSEKITLVALALSFFGLTLFASGGLSLNQANLLGILLGTVSGLMYAFSIIIYKYLLKDLSVFALIFYQSSIGALILLPFVASRISLSLPFLWLLVFAFLFGIVATLLHFKGIKRVTAQHAGILGYSEPVFGTAYAFLFFAEVPSLTTLLGGALIVFGGYLIFRTQR